MVAIGDIPRLSARAMLVLAAVGGPLLICLLLLPLRPYLSPTDVAMVLLLWVSLLALYRGAMAALLTTVCAMLALNWNFVPPYNTLDVHDSANLLSFVLMAAFGFFISYLAGRLRLQLAKRRQLMSQLRGMYRLATGLNRQPDWPSQCAYAARLLSRRLRCAVQISCGAKSPPAGAEQRLFALGSPPAGWLSLPNTAYPAAQTLVNAACSLLSQHWQLQQLQEQNARQHLTVEREQQRAALLRSLSHDLRTPLSTILGASSMLADPAMLLSDSQRQQQAQNIYQQSLLLNNHFEKVLELSKAQLQSAALQVSTFSSSELVAGALARRPDLSEQLAALCQQVGECVLAGDLTLLEMALANLLENAWRHGTSPYQLDFSVSAGGVYQLCLQNAMPAVRARPQADSGHGLGLLICQTVAALHQGSCELQLDSMQARARLRWQAPAASASITETFRSDSAQPALGSAGT